MQTGILVVEIRKKGREPKLAALSI